MGERAETRATEKAIRLGWPIPDELKQSIIDRAQKVIDNPVSDDRHVSRASSLIIRMNAQNVDIEKASNPEVGFNVNLDAADPEQATRLARELLHDPDYLEYRRARLAETDASVVCTECEPGTSETLGTGEAPTDD